MPVKNDRRSSRTRQLLGNALVSLMQEKPYHAITVQDLIDRADVGRSTFYAHYPDKDSLLMSQLSGVIESLRHDVDYGEGKSPTLFPVLGLFRHVQQNAHLYKALVGWGHNLDFVSSTAQKLVSSYIETQLQVRLGGQAQPDIPLSVLSHHLAGTFVTLLRWWLDNNMPYPPEQMDTWFWQLVTPGVEAALGAPL